MTELCLTRLALHNLKLETGVIFNRSEVSEYPTYMGGVRSVEQIIFRKAERIIVQPVTPIPDFIKTEQIDSAVNEHFKEFNSSLSPSHQLIIPIPCFNQFSFAAVFKITKIEPEIDGQFIFGDQTEVFLKLQTVKDERIPRYLQQSLLKSVLIPRSPLFNSFPKSEGLETFFKTVRYGKYPLSTALIYGPFGAGKRTLIRRIADDLGVPFYQIDLYDLKEEFLSSKSQKFAKLLEEKFELYGTIVLEGLELLDEEMKIRSIWAQISRTHSERDLRLICSYSFLNNSKSVSNFISGSFDLVEEIKMPGSSVVKKLTKELVELVPEAAEFINPEDEFIGYSLDDFANLIDRFKRNCSSSKSFENVFNEYKKLLKFRKSLQSNTLEIPKVTWDEVAGLTEVKEVLKDLIGKLQKKPRPTGVLLHGPPGTGKTLIAKALATQSRFALIPVKGPELLSPYIGESESSLREIFAQARSMSPCIIFFDELDALVPRRGEFGDSVGVSDRMVATFMTEMDKINGLNVVDGDDDDCVFVIGATNRPDLIDLALMRKGRFDISILLDSPKTIEERAAILAASCSKLNHAPGIDFLEPFKHVTNKTDLSPAQIASIATNASKMALEKKLKQLQSNPEENNLLIDPITTEDLIESITKLFI